MVKTAMNNAQQCTCLCLVLPSRSFKFFILLLIIFGFYCKTLGTLSPNYYLIYLVGPAMVYLKIYIYYINTNMNTKYRSRLPHKYDDMENSVSFCLFLSLFPIVKESLLVWANTFMYGLLARVVHVSSGRRNLSYFILVIVQSRSYLNIWIRWKRCNGAQWAMTSFATSYYAVLLNAN